jgi:uncharacterized protein (DUF2147 family)
MKQILTAVALLSLATAAHPAQASNPGSLEGRWTSPKRNLIINVAQCGAAHCGTVVWASPLAKEQARKSGTPNLVGKQLITGVRPDGQGGYKGRAFVPKQNIHATATIQHAGPNAMVVKGCALGVICKSQRWTRLN